VDKPKAEDLFVAAKDILVVLVAWGLVLALASATYAFFWPIASVMFDKAHEAGKAVAEWLK
jgi:hypothetical protein